MNNDVALTTALAAIDRAIGPDPNDQQLLIAAKCKGLMVGYSARWSNAGWETVSVEEQFHLPVVNPETGRQSRTFTQAGKYDGVVSFTARNYLLEHKTTSEDIADPNSPYWRRLVIDSQVSAYVLANWQNGRKVDGTLYDVIRKPGIRPKSLTKAERASIVSSGRYCNYRVSDAVRTAIAAGQERECCGLYSLRLAAETIEQPDKYFQRRTIQRLDGEVLEWADELWDVAKEIGEARKNGRHYRNSDACMTYGSPCEFLGICSGHDSPDSDRWQKREKLHAELPVNFPIDNGLSVLTNSRIRCFQTCRRKHYLRYELGLERQDDEEREATYFGSVFHAALEAWWSCFFPKELANDCDKNGLPATDAGRLGAVSDQAELV